MHKLEVWHWLWHLVVCTCSVTSRPAIATVDPSHYRAVSAAGLKTLNGCHMQACKPSIHALQHTYMHNSTMQAVVIPESTGTNGSLPSKTDFMRSSLFLRLLWRPCKSSAATRASLTTLSPSCRGGRSDQDNLSTVIGFVERIHSDRTGIWS